MLTQSLPELIAACATCAALVMGLASPAEVTWLEGPWVPTVVCVSVDGCRIVRPPAPLPTACAGTPLVLAGAWYTLASGQSRVSFHAAGASLAGVSLTYPTSTSTRTVTAAPEAFVWETRVTSSVRATGDVEFNASTAQGCTARVRIRR